MKLTLRLVLALALIAGVSTGPVRAEGARQTVEGEVLFPTAGQCASHELAEAIWRSVMPDPAEDAFSFRFVVKPATRGSRFVLTAGAPGSDLDIIFFGRDDVVFEGRSFGGEAGIVPAGAKRAAVCIYSGAVSRFTYVAGG